MRICFAVTTDLCGHVAGCFLWCVTSVYVCGFECYVYMHLSLSHCSGMHSVS